MIRVREKKMGVGLNEPVPVTSGRLAMTGRRWAIARTTISDRVFMVDCAVGVVMVHKGWPLDNRSEGKKGFCLDEVEVKARGLTSEGSWI